MAGMPWDVEPETAPNQNQMSSETTGGMPWDSDHPAAQPDAKPAPEGSMWESIKSTLGARADAIAAGLLADEGSDRSRYAMKLAERSNTEAREQESRLSTLQRVGVGAVDIGAGLASAAIPAVGPAVAAGYFTGVGAADQLRMQAEETGRYDLAKAVGVGALQSAAAEATGGLARGVIGTGRAINRVASSAVGGGAGGASMQMISNIANGKDITEGVGESAIMGAAGGLGAHGAIATARSIGPRLPRTVSDVQGAGAAESVRRQTPMAEETTPSPEDMGVPPRQPTVQAEEGAIPTEPTPTSEPTGPSGFEPFNPNMYGEYKGPTRLQAGQGFGPGAPEPMNQGSISGDVLASGRHGTHMAQKLWRTFRQEGLDSLVSPKGVKQMADAEITTQKLGLRTDKSLVNRAKETEGSIDVLQQQLENLPVGSPEYQQQVNAISNLSMESGSAAAHTRANALALDTGMPMTAKFHDVTLHEGVANENTPRNIARDVHGMTAADINAEHRAVLESKGSSILGGNRAAEQAEKYQTYESHFNATNKAYKTAKQKVSNAFDDNYELALRTRESLSRSEQPELYQRAQDLTDAMDELRQLKNQVSNGDPINTDKLAILQRRITDNGTALGLTPQFKNVLGQTGTFNPTLDLQAWHNFNQRTRLMHTSAPKGTFKDMTKSDLGIEGFDITKPGSWIKPVKNIALSAARRHESVSTQAKGSAMAKEALQRPERATEEQINSQLKQGNTESATVASEQALKDSGINTSGPTLADTPAQEIRASQPEIDSATRAHVDTLLRGSRDIVDAQNAEAAAQRAARPEQPVPEETAPIPEGTQEPTGQGVPQKPKPTVQPKTEEEAPAPKPTEEETPSPEEAAPSPDKPVESKSVDFKTDESGNVTETPVERDKRVASMAKKMISDKVNKTINTPIKQLSKDHKEALSKKAEAEGMKKGINDILSHSKDIADKEGVHQADVLHAVMSREGGIESIFKDGFGKDAIKGRINSAVKAYKAERRAMARQNVEEASQIVRSRLGEAKVGESQSARDDRITANLKSLGMDDDVINQAFKNASDVGKGSYTVRQVVDHARQILKQKRAEVKSTKPSENVNHIAHSREQLYKHIDSLGVDPTTRRALRTVVNNHTQIGGTGTRGALTEAEQKAALSDITKTLKQRAEDAKSVVSKTPVGSKARQYQEEKVSKIEEASNKAEQTRGSIESDLANVRASEAKAKEVQASAEKRAQEAEDKANEISSKLNNFLKEFEANQAKARADAKSELRQKAKEMDTTEIEHFGKVVGEELPQSNVTSDSPEYIAWKDSMDVAAETMKQRGMNNEANFLKHFGEVVDKGLKRREELPDRTDLLVTQTDYEQLRRLYKKAQKNNELDLGEEGNVQMGNMGQKLRTLLLGDASSSTRNSKIKYSKEVLESERQKALLEKNSVGEGGINAPGIK